MNEVFLSSTRGLKEQSVQQTEAHGLRVMTVPFGAPFLPVLTNWLMDQEVFRNRQDWRRVAIVFGGKRPALYVKRMMAERLGKVFFPPMFFSQESWIRWLAGMAVEESPAWALDLSYGLYQTAREVVPDLLQGREGFAAFYPWSRELLGFFDRLDCEQVPVERLRTIEDFARLGWDVPPQINRLLQQVCRLKQAFDQTMIEKGLWTPGRIARRALETLRSQGCSEFDCVVWAQPFSLTRIEEQIIRCFAQDNKAVLFVQGDQDHWPMLRRMADQLDITIKEPPAPAAELNPQMIAAANHHAMAAALRMIIESIPEGEREKTVVVVPESTHAITYLSALAGCGGGLNVSMGYPLENSGLVTLLTLMIQTQHLRRNEEYPAQDYLRVLQHPLIKTLRWQDHPPTAARVLVHKIEEWLKGWRDDEQKAAQATRRRLTAVEKAGRLVVTLDLIEAADEIQRWASEDYRREEPNAPEPDWSQMIRDFHQVLFRQWESVTRTLDLAVCLKEWIAFLETSQALGGYPLNLLAAERVLRLVEEFELCACAGERFESRDLFRLLTQRLGGEKVAFRGVPLKGLQVLGLFETRALDFERVIVMDAQEGVLPTPLRLDPLIPQEVKRHLALETVEMQEIQRYQWMRLLSGAKESVVIYLKDDQHERSRFIEEVIWWREKKGLPCHQEQTIVLPGALQPVIRQAAKTKDLLDALQSRTFSPTALDVYMTDPWEFYLRYGLNRRPLESALADIEANHIGDVVHKTLYAALRPYVGERTVPDIDKGFMKRAGRLLDKHFKEKFGEPNKASLYMLKKVLDERMTRFWLAERERLKGVKRIVALEQEMQTQVALPSGRTVFLKGRIDRVDELQDGTMMILDYKTGTSAKTPRKEWMIDGTVDRVEWPKRIQSWQLPVYYLIAKEHYPSQPITTMLYLIRQPEKAGEHIFPHKTSLSLLPQESNEDAVAQAIIVALDALFCELFDANLPFEQILGPVEPSEE